MRYKSNRKRKKYIGSYNRTTLNHDGVNKGLKYLLMGMN